jgi:hypothetical protein
MIQKQLRTALHPITCEYELQTVLRIRDPVHFYPKDPDPGSGQIFFPGIGSRILNKSQIQYIFKILPLKMAKNRKNLISFEI